MKILHVNAGNEYGGGLFHILSLFQGIKQLDMELLVFEEGPVAESARKNGITVHIVSQQSRYDLSVLSKLKGFIDQGEYAIVHTHGPRANLFLSLIRSKINAKWIATIHSDPTLDFKERGIKGKVFEKINVQTFKRMDHLIAVSSEIKGILLQYKVPDERVTVVHNGRDFTPQQPQPKVDSETFKLIAVGRLEWVKGHRYLLQALKEVPASNWTLTICGTGEEERTLKALASELELSERVRFLGWIEAQEVSRQIEQSDIMILPSLSESFPLVALEAGEKCVPVIASNVGDIKEMIPDRNMGWIVPAQNSSRLTEAINEAYKEWENKELAEKGSRFYRWSSQFTIQKQAFETLEVYKKTAK